jgi:N-acetylglucosaminyl-diphospho-decaprenol L-rhamnosyltransferase
MEANGDRPTPACSVVVLTYRSAETLAACLASVRPQVDALDGELVVIDNASPDETVEVARAAGVEAVRSRRNLGFAAGCNLGARHASGRVLVFVNPDAVLDPGCLQAVLDALADDASIGVVGGRAHTSDGDYDPRCVLGTPSLRGALGFALGLDHVFRHHPLLAPEQGPAELSTDRPVVAVPAVSGALVALPRQVWERLQGFDEDFFLYGEDVDLCLRAARAGWRSVVATGAGYQHVGGISSSSTTRDVMLYRGKVELYRRQLSPLGARVAVTALQAGALLRATASFVSHVRGAESARRWPVLFRGRNQWREGHLRHSAGEVAR